MSGLEGFYFSGDVLKPSASGGEAFDPRDRPDDSLHPFGFGYDCVDFGNESFLAGNQSHPEFLQLVGRCGIGTNSLQLAAHAQTTLMTPPRSTSARIISDVGVVATAIGSWGDSRVLVNGQGTKSQAYGFVAPYFKNSGENIRSQLALVNSTNGDAEVTVTFFAESGSLQLPAAQVPLRANGSALISGQADGWLLIESTVPIGGLVVVTSGNSRTTLPLQVAPSDRMLFSRFHDDDVLGSTLNLVGTRERDAVVTVTWSRPDGTTIAKRDNIADVSPGQVFSKAD